MNLSHLFFFSSGEFSPVDFCMQSLCTYTQGEYVDRNPFLVSKETKTTCASLSLTIHTKEMMRDEVGGGGGGLCAQRQLLSVFASVSVRQQTYMLYMYIVT
jgi:hypothetical protein